MLKTSLLLLLFMTVLSSCSEEFDMNIPDISHRVVLEGAITNEEGPYFFKLSLSKDLSINKEGLGITDALIVISDNIGISDTLKLLPTSIQRHPKWFYYFISIKKYSGVIDTIRLIGGDTTSLRGIYYTTRIQGRPGNKYSLMINYKNSIIQASEEMPSVPVIDSVQFREQFLERWQPCLWTGHGLTAPRPACSSITLTCSVAGKPMPADGKSPSRDWGCAKGR